MIYIKVIFSLISGLSYMFINYAYALNLPPSISKLIQAMDQTAVMVLPHPDNNSQPWILVDVASQQVWHFDAQGYKRRKYIVSTSSRGVGEQEGSLQTPRGWHTVCNKIGNGVAENTIIYKRNITPWLYTDELHNQYPNKDWILTRILWLCGSEDGKNKGGKVDSYDRAIYFHGAGNHVKFGVPSSRGCIRMKNQDVIDLFDNVDSGIAVLIHEDISLDRYLSIAINMDYF